MQQVHEPGLYLSLLLLPPRAAIFKGSAWLLLLVKTHKHPQQRLEIRQETARTSHRAPVVPKDPKTWVSAKIMFLRSPTVHGFPQLFYRNSLTNPKTLPEVQFFLKYKTLVHLTLASPVLTLRQCHPTS